jgi:hypothetical protein
LERASCLWIEGDGFFHSGEITTLLIDDEKEELGKTTTVMMEVDDGTSITTTTTNQGEGEIERVRNTCILMVLSRHMGMTEPWFVLFFFFLLT